MSDSGKKSGDEERKGWGPRSAFWWPWAWEEFPPTARAYTGPLPRVAAPVASNLPTVLEEGGPSGAFRYASGEECWPRDGDGNAERRPGARLAFLDVEKAEEAAKAAEAAEAATLKLAADNLKEAEAAAAKQKAELEKSRRAGILPRSWDFQFMTGRAAPKTPNDAYTVFCAIALSNARQFIEAAWCELLVYQHQLIAAVACLVVSRAHPAGQVRFFSPTPIEKSAGWDGMEDMGAFRQLLDGAARVCVFNDHEFFGMLRASPNDVTDLNTACPWASFERISENATTDRNPFRPKPDDPYFHIMSADLPHPVPRREEAEEITIPDIVIPPDPDWTPTKPLKENVARASGVGLAGASSYNSEDTQADIERYLASKRWRSDLADVEKPAPPYLRDGEMIYWMFKCFSITADADLEGLSFADIIAWNHHQPWWTKTETLKAAWGKRTELMDFARRHCRPAHPNGPTTRSIVGQMQYTSWAQHKRWGAIQSALEWEVRSLADLMTAIYVKTEYLVCFLKKWNGKMRRYEDKWMRARITLCTPSVLKANHSHGEAPPNVETPKTNRGWPGRDLKMNNEGGGQWGRTPIVAKTRWADDTPPNPKPPQKLQPPQRGPSATPQLKSQWDDAKGRRPMMVPRSQMAAQTRWADDDGPPASKPPAADSKSHSTKQPAKSTITTRDSLPPASSKPGSAAPKSLAPVAAPKSVSATAAPPKNMAAAAPKSLAPVAAPKSVSAAAAPPKNMAAAAVPRKGGAEGSAADLKQSEADRKSAYFSQPPNEPTPPIPPSSADAPATASGASTTPNPRAAYRARMAAAMRESSGSGPTATPRPAARRG